MTTKQKLDVYIRWMLRPDMPAVLDIEDRCYANPWEAEDFIRCCGKRHCIPMVAEFEEQVVGFMIYELHKTRLHVLNFSVDPNFHRRAIGQAMMGKLVRKLSHQRRNRILLEVRETNFSAQLFFRNIGFRAVSVLRDFYDDTTEDAYLMQYTLQSVTQNHLHYPSGEFKKLAADLKDSRVVLSHPEKNASGVKIEHKPDNVTDADSVIIDGIPDNWYVSSGSVKQCGCAENNNCCYCFSSTEGINQCQSTDLTLKQVDEFMIASEEEAECKRTEDSAKLTSALSWCLVVFAASSLFIATPLLISLWRWALG